MPNRVTTWVLVMEHAGRLDQARDYYQQALEIDPGNMEVMGHLARVYVKTDEHGERLRELLRELALGGGGNDWDVWARRQLLRLGD